MLLFSYKQEKTKAKKKKTDVGRKEKGVSPLDKAEHIAEQFHTGFVSQISCERNPIKKD